MFGVYKFHSYVYGHKFTLIADHQPLVSAARMQGWSLILTAYQYDIEYRRSAEHTTADASSRFVSTLADDRLDVDEYMISIWISYVNEFPVTAQDISSATRKDPVLSCVHDFTSHGWPPAVASMNFQLTKGCVLWGLRVVIPEVYRVRLSDDLHQEHHGTCRMKCLAKGYFGGPDWIRPSDSVLVRVMFVR